MTRRKVLIAVPSWGVAPPEAMDFRERTAFALGHWQAQPDCPYEFNFACQPDMLVQFAREEICLSAIATGMDFVGMIDDDMIGPVDIWKRLLEDDVDLVAPLAFTRRPPHRPVVYALRGGWIPGTTQRAVHHHFVLNYPKDVLFECDSVGFGAVLIKTDVLRKLSNPWFFNMSGSNGTGEDIFFCRRAQEEAGARIFCDSRVKLGHLALPRRYAGEVEYEAMNPDVHIIREELGEWSRDKAKQNLAA